MTVNILVIGGGASGAFYASRFHQSDNVQVSIICRSNYQVVLKHGFKIISKKLYGTYVWKPHRVFKSVHDSVASEISFDYVLVTTKNVPAVEKVEDLITPIVNYHTSIGKLPMVVLFQNGVEIEKPLITKFPFLPVASVTLHLSASQNTEGVIDYNDDSIQKMIFGLYSGHYQNRDDRYQQDTAALAELVDILSKVLNGTVLMNILPYDPCDENIHYKAHRYYKLLWNSSFGSVCTLTNCDTSEVLANPDTRDLLRELMKEVYSVAERHLNRGGNIVFPPEGSLTIDDYLTRSELIGHYRPSIQLDFDYKRPMEVEILFGNVVNIAKELGIEMKRMSTNLALMRMLQSKLLSKN